MKKSSVLFIALLLSIFAFGQEEGAESKGTKIDIYYFHRTERCQTCMSIEENTKTTLETYFANEVKEGVISFQSINFEGEEDKDLIEKYKADGPSLFLTKMKKGKETTKNLTDFALENSLYNPEKFNKGLRDDLNKLLR
jgi:hypothetical protein